MAAVSDIKLRVVFFDENNLPERVEESCRRYYGAPYWVQDLNAGVELSAEDFNGRYAFSLRMEKIPERAKVFIISRNSYSDK